jgi:nicotinamidase-related amidase
MKTLIVIDMQNAWLANPAKPCCDTAGVVERINHAAASVRAEGGRVVFVQHADDEAVAGSDAWKIISTLTVCPEDATVDKRACDAFAETSLAQELAVNGSDPLYICGFATEFCVDTTVRAAASRGMNVVVLDDAHTTSNRPHLTADAIIAHHNWVWSNMALPANSALAVKTTAEAFSHL